MKQTVWQDFLMRWFEWKASYIQSSLPVEGELYYLCKETLGPYFYNNEPIPDDRRLLLEQRYCAWSAGQPLAYCLGTVPFLDMELDVTPSVLIPRSATEYLVHLMLSHPSSLSKQQARVLDIGTGSGCIAVSCAYYRPQWDVWAYDIAEAAVELAQRNAYKAGVTIHAQQQDLFDASCWQEEAGWDIIIANPPYLTEEEWMERPRLAAEPREALVDRRGDGLSCYEAILSRAKKSLRQHGTLWLEHGSTQGEVLRTLAAAEGLQTESFRDMEGHERILLCQVEAFIKV